MISPAPALNVTVYLFAVQEAVIVAVPFGSAVKFSNVVLDQFPVYPVRDIDTRFATVYSTSYVATNVAVCLSVDTVTSSLTAVIVPTPALNVTVYLFAVQEAVIVAVPFGSAVKFLNVVFDQLPVYPVREIITRSLIT